MSYRFERFMALRYLKGAQGRDDGRRFLRFITYVAVGGVAIGVAALLLALAIVRGFSQEIQDKIIGFGAHVQVGSYQDTPLDDAAALQAALLARPEVATAVPVLNAFTLLRKSANDIDGVVLWGTEALPPYLADHLVAGYPDFAPARPAPRPGTDTLAASAANTAALPGIIIGRQLAGVLGLDLGDRVTAFSMQPSERSAALPRPRLKAFVVTGIYETSLANFDVLYAFADLNVARDLVGYGPNQVTRFDLMLHDIDQAMDVALAIEETYGFPVKARTIREVFGSLFAWVNLQESIIPLVIGVIIIVAAFNIIGTLLMMILEKTREMGVLVSMGASARSLKRLFLAMGVLIGVVGTALGAALALVLAGLQLRYNLIPLPEEAYYMKTAPIALEALDFVIVAVVAIVLCAASAYIPARVAARIAPIRAIRFR